MAFFTVAEVRQAAASAARRTITESDSILASAAESVLESEAARVGSSYFTKFDAFLSHAYSDKIVVLGLYSLLTGMGYSIYVDWIHDRHRLNRAAVSASNAAILRDRMHQCKSLLFATTQNYTSSKWMPWECGYFDGFDSKAVGSSIRGGHVAVLPVVQSTGSSFTGQEYLGLYPVAQKRAALNRGLEIHNQTNTLKSMSFDAWIANGHP